MNPPSETKRTQLADFIRKAGLAVLSSTGAEGHPQAALIDIAVMPDLTLVFETTCGTRKAANIERDPRVALVIGWSGPQTMQVEGIAEMADGRRLEQARETFLAAFPRKSPDEHWPGNNYYVVTPRWLRFSSYYRPRFIEEYQLQEVPTRRTGGWRGMLQRHRRENPSAP
jgi:pyridoxine/pyridoxamine 5'-phosphate oxidase